MPTEEWRLRMALRDDPKNVPEGGRKNAPAFRYSNLPGRQSFA